MTKFEYRYILYGSSDFKLSQSVVLNVAFPENNRFIFSKSNSFVFHSYDIFYTRIDTLMEYSNIAIDKSTFTFAHYFSNCSLSLWKTYYIYLNDENQAYYLNTTQKVNILDIDFICLLNQSQITDFGIEITLADYDAS